MMQILSEIHIVGGQLQQLRKTWDAIYEQYPPNSHFASTYITLCTTIEYITAHHLRAELEALIAYTANVAPEGVSRWISRIDLHGKTHPYDQSRGRAALLRLLDKELWGATKLTFGEIQNLRKWLCGESLSDFCKTIDGTLYSDFDGLFKLRHVFAHGRPLRLDAAETSPHHFDNTGFSLKEAVKTLKRIGLLSDSPDVREQIDMLHEAIFSYEAIQFYWERVGKFTQQYVESVPLDLSYHDMMEHVLKQLKPLK
jgi:hypothetical protein